MESDINLTEMLENKGNLRNNGKDYEIDRDTPFKWKKHLVLPMFRITND